MAMSDGSVKSLELWNDGPAVQATLGQMQQFQVQMQRQLQEQVEQMQLLMGSLPQSSQPAQAQPQQAYGFPIPIWPQQPPSMMPFFPPTEFPKLQKTNSKRAKIRAGRLGKRERAEMRASRSGSALPTGDPKSELSEEEPGSDDWLIAGKPDAATKGGKVDIEAVQEHLDQFARALKADFVETCSTFLENAQKMTASSTAHVRDWIEENHKQNEHMMMQMKTELQEFMVEHTKASITNAITEVQKESLTLKADFVSSCNTFLEDAQKMTNSSTAHVRDGIEENHKQNEHMVMQMKTELQEFMVEHTKETITNAITEVQKEGLALKADFVSSCNTFLEDAQKMTTSSAANVKDWIEENHQQNEHMLMQMKTELQEFTVEHTNAAITSAITEVQKEGHALKADFVTSCSTFLEDAQKMTNSSAAHVKDLVEENHQQTEHMTIQMKTELQEFMVEHTEAAITSAIAEVQKEGLALKADFVEENHQQNEHMLMQMKTELQEFMVEHTNAAITSAITEVQKEGLALKADFVTSCSTFLEDAQKMTTSSTAHVKDLIEENQQQNEHMTMQMKTELQEFMVEHTEAAITSAITEVQKESHALKAEFVSSCNTFLEDAQKMTTSSAAHVRDWIEENHKQNEHVIMQMKSELQECMVEHTKTAISNAITEVQKEGLCELSAQIQLANANAQQALEKDRKEIVSQAGNALTDLRVDVTDKLHNTSSKLDILAGSLDELKADMASIHEYISAEDREMRKQANALPETRTQTIASQDAMMQVDQGAIRSSCKAPVSTCQIRSFPAVGSGLDKFSSLNKWPGIILQESDTVASRADCQYTWASVYGKQAVTTGQHQWNVEVVSAQASWENNWQMIIGVGMEPFKCAESLCSTGFGYIKFSGKKTTRNGREENYASGYNAGDVVSVVLDMTKLCLSFKKNGKDLGVSHSIPRGSYHLAVSMFMGNQTVKLRH